MNTRYGDIAVHRDGLVAIVELNRPPHNHVSVALVRDLANALDDIDSDKGLRATLLTAAGKSFCAGADLNDPSAADAPARSGAEALYAEAARLFAGRKPVVAAVQGAAIGAGLGLALAADFRIAAPEARFSANFVKLGFHPGFGITHTLPRLIGTQKAALMCLTGRRIKADEAHAWGLVDQVAPREELHATALALARELAENAPLAVEATRATLREGLVAALRAQTGKEASAQASLRQTGDFVEGVRSVAERRPGNFTGA